MVLERIDMRQLGAHAVRQAETVAGRAIVVARREPLNMQPANPTRRENDGLRGNDDMSLIVEVFEDGATASPAVITE